MINYKMKTKRLIAELSSGVYFKPERFQGDDHRDSGGPVEIEDTDALMVQAADMIADLENSIGVLKSQLASEQSHSADLEKAYEAGTRQNKNS